MKRWVTAGVVVVAAITVLVLTVVGRTQEAVWYLPEGYVPDPGSETVNILVYELDCTSGQGAAGNTTEPRVSLTSTTVVIEVRTYLRRGGNCLGHPLAPVEVSLGEPLGTRELVDGNGTADDDSNPHESIFEGNQIPPAAAPAAG